MCEKKIVKKTKRFRDNKRFTESGEQECPNRELVVFFSFATVVTAIDDRQTECNKTTATKKSERQKLNISKHNFKIDQLSFTNMIIQFARNKL